MTIKEDLLGARFRLNMNRLTEALQLIFSDEALKPATMFRHIRRLSLNFLFCASFTLIVAACKPKTDVKPMDVENPKWEFDYNLFSINPNWHYMLNNGTPPDPTKLCPVDSDDPAKWKVSSGTCTSQDIYLNQATGWNKFDCWVNGRAVQGHMNWFPVTYQGSLYWDSHSRPGGDDDYNFSIRRSDKALYTANYDLIHTEFDSDETVDQWDDTDTWWEHFHDAVDNDDAAAHEMLNGNYAIVIGLLGLDGGHPDFKSELHPVYGMFIHVKDDPSDDQWAFFIRNWGDEGSCSNNQEYINYSTLFVELPHELAGDVIPIDQNLWGVNFDDHSHVKVSYQKSAAGVLFAFNFDNPRNKECYVGDLHLRWFGTNIQKRDDFKILTFASTPSSMMEFESANKDLVDKLQRLPVDSQRQLLHQLRRMNDNGRSKVRIVPDRNMAKFDLSKLTKEIAEIKRTRKLPNYRSLIMSEDDPSIYIQKKRKLDLITRFVNEH
jgi:hypothetical protein